MSVIEQLLRQHGYTKQQDVLPQLVWQQQQMHTQLQQQLQQQQLTMAVFQALLYCAQVQKTIVHALVAERAPQHLLVINPQPMVADELLKGLSAQLTIVDKDFQKLPGSSVQQQQQQLLQYDMVLCFDVETFWQSQQKACELLAFMRQSLSHTNKNALALCFFRDAHRVLTAYYQAWPQTYRATRTAQRQQQQWDHRLKRPAVNDPRFSMQEMILINADPYSPHYEKHGLLFPESLLQLAHHYGLRSFKAFETACLEQNDAERSCKHFSTKYWQLQTAPQALEDQYCRTHAVVLLQL